MESLNKNCAIAALESSLALIKTKAGVSTLAEVETALADLRTAFDADPDGIPETEIRDMWLMLQALEMTNFYNLSRIWWQIAGYVTHIEGTEDVWLRNNGGVLEYSTNDKATWKAVFQPDAHTHPVAEIPDFPTTMPPKAHTHPVAEIPDFPAKMPPEAHTHTLADIIDYKEGGEDMISIEMVTCGEGESIAKTSPPGKDGLTPYDREQFSIVAQCVFFNNSEQEILSLRDYGDNLYWRFGKGNGSLFFETLKDGVLVRTNSTLNPEQIVPLGTPCEIYIQTDLTSGNIVFSCCGIAESHVRTALPGGIAPGPTGRIYIGKEARETSLIWVAISQLLYRDTTKSTPYPIRGHDVVIPGVLFHAVVENEELRDLSYQELFEIDPTAQYEELDR